jgi:hypothetical protein
MFRIQPTHPTLLPRAADGQRWADLRFRPHRESRRFQSRYDLPIRNIGFSDATEETYTYDQDD